MTGFAVGIWPWLEFPDPKPGERIPGLPEYDIQEKLAYHFPQKVFTLAQRSAMSVSVFGDILMPSTFTTATKVRGSPMLCDKPLAVSAGRWYNILMTNRNATATATTQTGLDYPDAAQVARDADFIVRSFAKSPVAALYPFVNETVRGELIRAAVFTHFQGKDDETVFNSTRLHLTLQAVLSMLETTRFRVG